MSEWFIEDPDGVQIGPLSLQDVQTRIARGTLTRETLVWTQKMLDWEAANKTSLEAEFVKFPPPLPRFRKEADQPSRTMPHVKSPISKSILDISSSSEQKVKSHAAPSHGFIDAISICLSKYATFSGRASRSEYWYWAIFSNLLQLSISFLEGFFAGRQTAFGWIVVIILFLPSIAVGARRLHDIDRSGWWQFLIIIPVVGWIILIFWNCKRGVEHLTRFD